MDDTPNPEQEWLKKETQLAYDQWLSKKQVDWWMLTQNEEYSDMLEDQFMEEYFIRKHETKEN